MKNGVKAALLGRPNAGKSSLLNALAGYDRAIVTDIPGTTRDTVEEKIRLGNLTLRLIDTAGIRAAEDAVEKIGVDRAIAAAAQADLALLVLDASSPLTPEDQSAMKAAGAAKHTVCVVTKCDLPRVLKPEDVPFEAPILVSAVTGEGLDLLTQAIAGLFSSALPCDGTLLTNTRHIFALSRARDSIEKAQLSMELGETPDAVLLDVEAALEAISEVTGRSMREDITNGIFSRFCVGK